MIPALLPTYRRMDVAFDHGQGAWLFDRDGRRYLDFCSGIAVTALGHAHPHLVATLRDQAGKLWHTSNLFRIPEQERLADRLVAASFADTVFFTNSGTEAIELAIKMARKYHDDTGAPDRHRLITFGQAFHGRTLAAIAAAGQDKLIDGFGPLPGGFDIVDFADLDAVRAAIGPETAGIMVETVQGEGGIRPLPTETLQALRQIADDNGLLLILDEIQCGMGRTGKLFAFEWTGIAPDIVTAAKGIGSGFPFGACLATEKAAQGMTAGTHGSTYGGNPLAMAVGNAVLDEMLKPGFLDHVSEMGRLLEGRLAALQQRFPGVVREVRGRGLMLGVKLAGVEPRAFVPKLLDRGLVTAPAGDNVIRLLPPLIVGPDEIDAAIAILEGSLADLAAEAAPAK